MAHIGYGIIPLSEFSIIGQRQVIQITPPRHPLQNETFYFVVLNNDMLQHSGLYNFSSNETLVIVQRTLSQKSDLEYYLISLDSTAENQIITGFLPLPLKTLEYAWDQYSKIRKYNVVLIPNYDTTYHILLSNSNKTIYYYTNSSDPKTLDSENQIFVRENSSAIISFEFLPQDPHFMLIIDSMELHNDELRDQEYYYEPRTYNIFISLLFYNRYSGLNLIVLPTNKDDTSFQVCSNSYFAFIQTPHMVGHIDVFDENNQTIDIS